MDEDQSAAWYINTGKKIQGPFSVQKIRQYAQQGRLKSHHRLSTDQNTWATPEECGFSLVGGHPQVHHDRDPGESGVGPAAEDEVAVARLLCQSCEQEIPAGAAFCSSCGKAVRDESGLQRTKHVIGVASEKLAAAGSVARDKAGEAAAIAAEKLSAAGGRAASWIGDQVSKEDSGLNRAKDKAGQAVRESGAWARQKAAPMLVRAALCCWAGVRVVIGRISAASSKAAEWGGQQVRHEESGLNKAKVKVSQAASRGVPKIQEAGRKSGAWARQKAAPMLVRAALCCWAGVRVVSARIARYPKLTASVVLVILLGGAGWAFVVLPDFACVRA